MKGWLYEKKVNDKFIEEFGLFNYIPEQWFKYQAHGDRLRFCQTDGLLFFPKQFKVSIIEIKYKHTPDAYFQIEDKYVPVVKRLFPGWTVSVIEVVRWYDPSTTFPVPVHLVDNIANATPGQFGVHIVRL